jgi:hypothetical protein
MLRKPVQQSRAQTVAPDGAEPRRHGHAEAAFPPFGPARRELGCEGVAEDALAAGALDFEVDRERTRKRGFGVPVAAWFRTVWRDRLRMALLDELPKEWEIFDRAAVERLTDEHLNKGKDRSYLLFSLLMLSFQGKNT